MPPERTIYFREPSVFCYYIIEKETFSMTYAYARVSARDQNLSRQIEAFSALGIDSRYIFCDKKSGKDFDRSNYMRMIRRLRCGDLLVIKSIDRLGRNYTMIIEEWSRITKKIRADILVLDMPLLDTRTGADTLVGKFISDIVLQILSFVAENERENIRARQAEGIAAAKKKGVRFGRPRKVYTSEFIDIVKNYKAGNISLSQALSASRMTPGNFYHHCKIVSENYLK